MAQRAGDPERLDGVEWGGVGDPLESRGEVEAIADTLRVIRAAHRAKTDVMLELFQARRASLESRARFDGPGTHAEAPRGARDRAGRGSEAPGQPPAPS